MTFFLNQHSLIKEINLIIDKAQACLLGWAMSAT